jgi:hypothetical protein
MFTIREVKAKVLCLGQDQILTAFPGWVRLSSAASLTWQCHWLCTENFLTTRQNTKQGPCSFIRIRFIHVYKSMQYWLQMMTPEHFASSMIGDFDWGYMCRYACTSESIGASAAIKMQTMPGNVARMEEVLTDLNACFPFIDFFERELFPSVAYYIGNLSLQWPAYLAHICSIR